jgi:hypothetical protein
MAVVGFRDVILRDGTTLRLRAPLGGDADELLAFFARLSERSLYLRFHAVTKARKELVQPFLARRRRRGADRRDRELGATP